MKIKKLPIVAAAAMIMAAPLTGHAWWWDDDDDEEEIPFEEGRLFFELNDTDGDLGIHGKVDGDEWKYLEIEDPYDRKMINLWVRGRLRRQGLTELFFESAEPTFDDLDPKDFFNRFPEGEYDIEGITLDGEERESEVYLSHVIPAAPDNVMVGGENSASLESCEEEDGAPPIPVIANATAGVSISWDEVDSAHADLGTYQGVDFEPLPGDPDNLQNVEVLYYEVVIEIDETDFKVSAFVPGDITQWTFPGEFFTLAEGEEGFAQYKYELLVRTNVIDDMGEVVMVEGDDGEVPLPGNKSAMESCFLVPAP